MSAIIVHMLDQFKRKYFCQFNEYFLQIDGHFGQDVIELLSLKLFDGKETDR